MKVISTACHLLLKGQWYDCNVPTEVPPGDEAEVLACEGVLQVDDSTPAPAPPPYIEPEPNPDDGPVTSPATEYPNEKE